MNTYDRWMWIELIGFDNERADLGVEAFLDRAGFVPKAISLLLYNPDFVHTHDPRAGDRAFPDDFCSYAGHPANEERHRQSWTAFQLHRLIRELQRHGAKVYLSVFDLFRSKEWIQDHPELLYILKTGEMWPSLCPWKRLKDNTFYEDFFIPKLVDVMRDYGFDGFHGADGYGHPRVPLFWGDFSDDLVGQFLEATGIELPAEFSPPCGSNRNLIEKRAAWILAHKRRELMGFHVQRIQRFWEKTARALHAEGRQVVVNTAWTRDPFEAIWRYGTDYRKLAEAGVDGFVVEAASVALETLEESDSSRYLCQFEAAALLNKAYVPDVPMWWLHGIKDTEENWNALRHAPTALESEIHGMGNLYLQTPAGLRRCEDGLVVCLADSIRREEWQWLQEKWSLAFSGRPEELLGITLIWSDRALEAQLEDFMVTHRWSIHRWLHHLLGWGSPIFSVARIEDLDAVSGPVLALNIHLFSRQERERLFSYQKGPLAVLGEKRSFPITPPSPTGEAVDPGALVFGVYRGGRWINCQFEDRPPKDSMASCPGLADPQSWLNSLDYQAVSEEFVKTGADLLEQCIEGIRRKECLSGHALKPLRDEKAISIWGMTLAPRMIRLVIRNDHYICVAATIEVGQEIAQVHWRNPFTAARVLHQGSQLTVKVPGRGTAVLDVGLAETRPIGDTTPDS